MMKNVEQIKKLIEELELSPEGRKKTNEVFAKMEERGGIYEEEKQMLLDIMDAEMILAAMEVKAYDANISEIDKVLAETK